MYKKCTKCKITKVLEDFHFRKDKQKYRSECKDCTRLAKQKYSKTHKEEIKKSGKLYRNNNKDKEKERHNQYQKQNIIKIQKYFNIYYVNNKERIKGKQKIYYIENKSKINQRNKSYNHTHRSELNANERKRWATDPNYKLSKILRARLRIAIKSKRKPSMNKLLSCSIEYLWGHLESLFYNHPITGEKMTKENFGKWHIDHIIPLSSFNLTREEDLLIACNYLNLQPLWAEDNLSKWKKIPENYELIINRIKESIRKSSSVSLVS